MNKYEWIWTCALILNAVAFGSAMIMVAQGEYSGMRAVFSLLSPAAMIGGLLFWLHYGRDDLDDRR